MEDVLSALSASLVSGISGAVGLPASGLRLRIPARGAAVACPLLGEADMAATRLTAADFPPVLGVMPVRHVSAKNGWLLFTLSDEFYTAALRYVQRTLPRPDSDGGCRALNRMRCMARAGGDVCPPDERVQRAWLLTLCAYPGGAALRRAKAALLSMTHHIPPRERAALAAACGGVADAAARALSAFSERKLP